MSVRVLRGGEHSSRIAWNATGIARIAGNFLFPLFFHFFACMQFVRTSATLCGMPTALLHGAARL
jgi:hypothetical protein